MRALAALFVLLLPVSAVAQGPLTLPAGLGEPRAQLRQPGQPMERRIAAARALGRHGPSDEAVAVLVAALEGEVMPPLRDEIMRSLARRASPAALPGLLPFAAEPRSMPSRELAPALLAIAAIGGPEAVSALVAVLEAGFAEQAASRALRRVGPAALPRLVRALDGPASNQVCRLLGELGDRRAIPALLAWLPRAPDATLVALVEALARLHAAQAAPAFAVLLEHHSSAVVAAALNGLARVGGRSQAAAIQPLLESSLHAPAALTALAAIDPVAATASLRGALASGQPGLRAAAVESLLSRPHRAWVPLLVEHYALDREPDQRLLAMEDAASALARIEAGSGMVSLLELLRDNTHPLALDVLTRSIALGVRRHGTAHPWSAAALSALRRVGDDGRRAWLLALARDRSVLPTSLEALTADDPIDRADAALALQLLGSRSAAVGPVLRNALHSERDAEACRRMTEAALALSVPVDPAKLVHRFMQPECGPESMLLAASRSVEPTRRLRVALRRALRGPGSNRTRVAGALALGILRDTTATGAVGVLLDEVAPMLRVAAVRALGAIGGPEAAALLRQHARVEADDAIHRLAFDALASAEGRAAGATLVSGDQLLEVRVSGPLASAQRVLLDVVLPDARWVRVRSRPGGELVLPGLPAGVADVQIAD